FPKLRDVEESVTRLESVQLFKDKDWNKHYLRPRAVYFDDKHEQYKVFADYLYPHGKENETLTPQQIAAVLRDGEGLSSDDRPMGKLTFWDIKYVSTNQNSDHFHLDHKEYYEAHMDNFRIGFSRGGSRLGLRPTAMK